MRPCPGLLLVKQSVDKCQKTSNWRWYLWPNRRASELLKKTNMSPYQGGIVGLNYGPRLTACLKDLILAYIKKKNLQTHLSCQVSLCSRRHVWSKNRFLDNNNHPDNDGNQILRLEFGNLLQNEQKIGGFFSYSFYISKDNISRVNRPVRCVCQVWSNL